MEIVNKKLEELKPYKNNSRTHSEEQINQIANSIKEYGFTNPILIDDENNVLAGHGRILGAKKLDMKEVPCVVISTMTDAQKKAYIIADNKMALNAGWDFDVLKRELQSLEDFNFDLELTGFSMDEIDNIMNLDDIDKDVYEDEFDVDKAIPKVPKSKYGDIYKLGKNRLMCGDATKKQDVKKLVDGAKIDLFITDPPYNVDYVGKTKDKLKIKNDSMGDNDFRKFIELSFKNADEVMKGGAVFYIWHADTEGYNFRGACIDVGWKVRECLIWNKNSMVLGRQDYQWKHEPCLYGWKDGSSHLWASDRRQTTVLDFDRPSKSIEHPTMKPIKLFDYQIKNNTKNDDAVLDLFGGSGTTLMACEQNRRKCYMMELDPKYVDVIIQRWEEFTGEKAIKIN